MLSALIFGCSRPLVTSLQQACTGFEDLYVYKMMCNYPRSYELLQLLNVFTPELVFLEVGPSSEALRAAAEIRLHSPKTAVVGFAQRLDQQQLTDATDAGVCDVLQTPFDFEDFQQTVARALDRSSEEKTGEVYAFLPAKAGSGSTTTALHLAGSLANEYKQKALLIEADLRSGPMAFLLNVAHGLSVADALENASRLNDEVWPKLPAQAQGLDVLLAPQRSAAVGYSRWNYQLLLSYAQRRYKQVIVDLPEMVDEGAEAVVTGARTVFVVSTPEASSLFLARKRVAELQSRGVWDTRIRIVLNRYTAKDAKIEEIEGILERRVPVVLPEDSDAGRATIDPERFNRGSVFRKSCSAFARLVAGVEAPSPPPPVEVVRQTGWRALFQRAFQHS